MEKDNENKTLAEETMDKVSGGIISNADALGAAGRTMCAQQNLDLDLDVLKLVEPKLKAGLFNVITTDQAEVKNVRSR